MADQSKDNSQLLEVVLSELVARNPDILSALVVSDDGLNVASGIPYHNDDEVALSTSDLTDVAEDFSNRLDQGKLTRILLEGEKRTTIVVRSSQHTILVVSIPSDAKVGLVMQSMRRAVNEITTIFG